MISLSRPTKICSRFIEIKSFTETLWLSPNVPEHFQNLTQTVVSTYPEKQPYGGNFNEIIPHLTIADRKTSEELSQITQKLKTLALEDLGDFQE